MRAVVDEVGFQHDAPPGCQQRARLNGVERTRYGDRMRDEFFYRNARMHAGYCGHAFRHASNL